MIYIASPYSHPDPAIRQERFERVRDFTAHMMNRNFTAFSPIVYCHELALAKSLPTNHLYWLSMNEEMMRLSFAICLLKLPGWTESKGVIHELEYASRIGRSVFQYEPDTFELSSFEER